MAGSSRATASTRLTTILEAISAGGSERLEEEVARQPYSVKTWVAYLEWKRNASFLERRVIYERALRNVPRSYKMWMRYLGEMEEKTRDRWTTSGRAEICARLYERALVHLHKMPRVWLGYCSVLRSQKKPRDARLAFDRALRALPITQHALIWPEYLAFATSVDETLPEVGVLAYRRYCMFEPNGREAFAEYLRSDRVLRIGEAAQTLASCVDDEDFAAPSGASRHHMWMRLVDLCAKYPEQVSKRGLDFESLVRAGLRAYKDEVGRLWCKLADYYVRLGRFEEARDVYEEACATVISVRDFQVVFDSYAQLEESVLSAKMRAVNDDDDDEEDFFEDDVDLRLARLEDLVARRPYLLSSAILRQNPHNVREWLARSDLAQGQDDYAAKKIVALSDAVKTIDPRKATGGKPSQIWIALASTYQKAGAESDARLVLQKATEDASHFAHPDDLAATFCFWAESEIERGDYDAALDVAHRAVLEPLSETTTTTSRTPFAAPKKGGKKTTGATSNETPAESVRRRAARSPKLWALYLDLEESLGTLASARAAYDKAMEIKVLTPRMALNYAEMLLEKAYFEDAFRVYEKSIALFGGGGGDAWLKDLWLSYADAFVKRYKGKKLERARDLFERPLAQYEKQQPKNNYSVPSVSKGIPSNTKIPWRDAAELYFKYAKFEETHGLARRAIAAYERAARHAPREKAKSAWLVYANKVEASYGAAKARTVYENAIKALADPNDAADVCLRFAAVETALGEVDRARAVFAHGAQFAEPSMRPSYWDKWRDFEVAKGNEDTFRDMLRVKRSVQTAHAINVHYVSATSQAHDSEQNDLGGLLPAGVPPASLPEENGAPTTSRKRDAAEGGADETEMEALERQAARAVRQADDAANAPLPSVTADAPTGVDPNEIDLGADDDDDDDDDQDEPSAVVAAEVEQRPVPAAVFGSVGDAFVPATRPDDDAAQPPQNDDAGEKPLGALARFRAAAK